MVRPRNIPEIDVKLIDSAFVKTSLSYTSKDIMPRIWGARGLITLSASDYESSQQVVAQDKKESSSGPDHAPKFLVSRSAAGSTFVSGYEPDLVFLGNAMILRPYIQPARTTLGKTSTTSYKVEG